MKNITRIQFETYPGHIINLGKSYYFLYDLKPERILSHSIDIEDKTEKYINGYSAIVFYIDGKVNYKNIVKTIIRKYITVDEEFDLINSANKDILAGNTDSENIIKYNDYLNVIESIKTYVRENMDMTVAK